VAAGLTLLAWQVQRTGTDNIARGLMAVGWWGAAGIGVLSLLRFTRALDRMVRADSRGRAAGTRARGHDSRAKRSAASRRCRSRFPNPPKLRTSADRSAASARAVHWPRSAPKTFILGSSVGIYVMAGAAALLYAYPVERDVRLAGMAAIGLTGGGPRRGRARWPGGNHTSLSGCSHASPGASSFTALVEHVRAFEQLAYGSTAHPAARLGIVILAATMFHVLSFLELWLTLWLITGESHARRRVHPGYGRPADECAVQDDSPAARRAADRIRTGRARRSASRQAWV
jgi:hypothetical protein